MSSRMNRKKKTRTPKMVTPIVVFSSLRRDLRYTLL